MVLLLLYINVSLVSVKSTTILHYGTSSETIAMFMPLEVEFLKYKTEYRNGFDEGSAIIDGSINDTMEKMFPAKMWVENGYLWKKQVSTEPATRIDVLRLQQQLNDALYTYKARETGICPIRRDLYDKCLQEIIRQVTVCCGEQGLLLYRIRNEILMTLKAYETVYESLIAFDFRKALNSNNEFTETKKELATLTEENSFLKNQLFPANQQYETFKSENNSKLQLLTTMYEEKIKELNIVILKHKTLVSALREKNNSRC